MTHTIGIIGSGLSGSGLARLAVAAGYHVVLSNSRGPETISKWWSAPAIRSSTC
jgi:predicted dinucleotide-binding enzyme